LACEVAILLCVSSSWRPVENKSFSTASSLKISEIPAESDVWFCWFSYYRSRQATSIESVHTCTDAELAQRRFLRAVLLECRHSPEDGAKVAPQALTELESGR
jgi:hypothetical protein